MKRNVSRVLLIALLAIGLSARGAVAQNTSENLLVSTELLLISQVNLAILSLSLISTNMEHDYTTVEQDRESLTTIVDSISLGQQTINALMEAKDIKSNDLEVISLLSKVNDALLSATNELIGYCDDGNESHFSSFSDDMDQVISNLQKVNKLL